MINSILMDRDGKTIPVTDLKEIRYTGDDSDVILTDFNSFKKFDHELYSFVGKNRTVNINGADLKSVVFDTIND